ncbi:Bikaverin cluster transcription factor bik5 [Trichoderma ghanense]|uniref:Bikaverin cluster transcription factor bik5 n=1 Tax=Trichoderma ghanense TaxID=65468 RepID=A0ABY2HI53_9HYPO
MEETNEPRQMDSAHFTQPTKADEPGSPRAGGGTAEEYTGHPQLNPYSCLSCRKRKKKCDRVYPCVNCRRVGAECLFVPRRPSTRPRTTQGMLERLQHLEGVIGHLRDNYSQVAKQPSSQQAEVRPTPDIREADSTPHSDSANGGGSQNDALGELGTELGRLAIGDGQSRYISSSFWASLDEEVDDLKSLLMDFPDDTKASNTTHTLNTRTTNQSFVFGINSQHQSLISLHPPSHQALLYWRLFKENCDRLIKVLHLPTTEPIIFEALKQPNCIPRGLEALIFSIYFAAVESLTESECCETFGNHKGDLIDRYKFATEQALARAQFLETDELIVLQAFVIFLMSLRNHCSIRLMWSLTALVVRLAQNAGIHRDGTHFGLSPFTVEMRRRLWWSICVLDSRACEDSGHDATLPHSGADTRVPLNINDSDLSVYMEETPQPRVGLTEMSFSLVRFEATGLFRQLQYSSTSPLGKRGKDVDLAEEIKQVFESQQRLQELYLKYCNLSEPFSWYIYTISQIIFTKMRLVAHHPSLRRAGFAGLPHDTQDRLFTASITILEYWLALNTEKKTQKWRWLCETYIQWYALSFLLSALCVRTEGEQVDRAWSAVDATLALGLKLSSACHMRSGMSQRGPSEIDGICCDAYKPLRRLMGKARAARSRAPLQRGMVTQEPGVCATHMIAQDEFGRSVRNPDSDASTLEHFINLVPQDGLYTTDVSASLEMPGFYHQWLHDLECPNQLHDGMSGGMNWDIAVGMDDLKPLYWK